MSSPTNSMQCTNHSMTKILDDLRSLVVDTPSRMSPPPQQQMQEAEQQGEISTVIAGNVVRVLACSMPKEMREIAVKTALLGILRFNLKNAALAAYIQDEFSKKYNPFWQCFVAESDFDEAVAGAVFAIRFKLNNMMISLFKSPAFDKHSMPFRWHSFEQLDFKVIESTMAQEMQKVAIETIKEAIVASGDFKICAGLVREEFDRRYGAFWHCIIGNFVTFVVYERYLIQLTVCDVQIQLFKFGSRSINC